MRSFFAPVVLTFNLLASKLTRQLLLVLELTVGTGTRDGRTDVQTDGGNA